MESSTQTYLPGIVSARAGGTGAIVGNDMLYYLPYYVVCVVVQTSRDTKSEMAPPQLIIQLRAEV